MTLPISEKLSKRVFDLMPAMIAVLDADGVIVAVNEGWRRFARENGGPASDDTGTSYLEVCRKAALADPASEAAAALQGIRAVLGGQSSGFDLDYPCHSPDRQRWYRLSAAPMEAPVHGAIVIHTDITALQTTERQLRASEQQFRLFFESSLDAALLISPGGRILAANPAAGRMFARSEAELPGSDWRALVDATEARFVAAFGEHERSGRFSGELTAIGPGGRKFPIELSTSMFAGKDGEHLSSVIVRDVSKRKELEAQRIESERRYLALFRDASDPIAIADANGVFEEVNPSFAALVGYTPEELPGMSVERIHPDGELARIRRHFADLFSLDHVAPVESWVVRKDGQRVEVEIRPTLIELGGRAVAQGIFIDLTERKRLEQVRLAQELEHRHTLVREVHHRIKNKLQSVAGLLRRELGQFLELDPRLEVAISQVNTIAVVHGLQASRDDEAIRLCDSVRDICKTVSELTQRKLDFEIADEHAGFQPVRIENTEAIPVALVLNELILNAVKHCPPGSPDPVVRLRADGVAARLDIVNAVASPRVIDLDRGEGLGTGLRLVRSLLPEPGAQLSYDLTADGRLHACLLLAAPVVVTVHPTRELPP